MKEVKFSSGAMLKVNLAPFDEADALFQAFAFEMKDVKGMADMDFSDKNFYLSMVLIGISSKSVRAALKQCAARSFYKNMQIKDDSFELPEDRENFMPSMLEIVRENLAPFMKGLYASSNQAPDQNTVVRA